MKGYALLNWGAVLAVAICACALAIAHLEFSFAIAVTMALGLVITALALLTAALLLHGVAARNRSVLKLAGHIIAGFAMYLGIINVVGPRRIAESQRRGDSIAIALATYYAEHGAYPERLSDLLPTQLREVPRTTMSALFEIAFAYHSSGQDYELLFPAPAWMQCIRGPSRRWKCDD